MVLWQKIFSVAVNVLLLLLVLYLIYLIRHPKFFFDSFAQTFNITSEGESLVDDPNVNIINFKNIYGLSGKIYHYVPVAKSSLNSAIIDIPGGAFVRCAVNLTAYRSMDTDRDVFLIEYPPLLEGTALQITEFVGEAIVHVLENLLTTEQTDISIVGSSAGAWYLTHCLPKINSNRAFKATVKRFVYICGYFGYSTSDNIIIKILDRLYISTDWVKLSGASPLPPQALPLLVFTADQDFLKSSSLWYSRINKRSPLIYKGTHFFFLNTLSESTQQAYSEFKAFLQLNTNGLLYSDCFGRSDALGQPKRGTV